MMDIWAAIMSVLALATVLERLLEGFWITVESALAQNPNLFDKYLKPDAVNRTTYVRFKTVFSLPLCTCIGIAATHIIQLQLGFSSNGNSDMNIAGALSGLLAPISHQLLLLVTQAQKALAQQPTQLTTNNPPKPAQLASVVGELVAAAVASQPMLHNNPNLAPPVPPVVNSPPPRPPNLPRVGASALTDAVGFQVIHSPV